MPLLAQDRRPCQKAPGSPVRLSGRIQMAFDDLYGLPVSTGSETAALAYRKGIELMLSAWPGASEAFERAIAADPDFALAHAARSRMHLIYAEMPAAQEKATAARRLVERNGTA